MNATNISQTVEFENPDNPHFNTCSEEISPVEEGTGPIFRIQAKTTPARPMNAEGKGSIIKPSITQRKREKNSQLSLSRPSGTGSKLIIRPMVIIIPKVIICLIYHK